MAKPFSAVALIFGIFNIVVGLVTMTCNGCQGGSQVMCVSFMSNLSKTGPGGDDILRIMWAVIERHVPSFVTYLIVSYSVSILMAGLLIVAGIGLCARQNWARWLSVFYAGVTILVQIVTLVYVAVILMPASERIHRDIEHMMQSRMDMPGQNPRNVPAADPFRQHPLLNYVWTFVDAGLKFSYSVLLLIIVLLPNVAAACSPDDGGEDDRREGRRRRGRYRE
jgi:hypothetical protein